MNLKTYTELSSYDSYEDRFNYLKLSGEVGKETFGFDRIFNQAFYRSKEWKDIRDHVIFRDNGCDLGHPDYPIAGKIIIHHMNIVTMEDLEKSSPLLLDPEYLVCVSHNTHNAIHYGDIDILPKPFVERRPNDTCPWKFSK